MCIHGASRESDIYEAVSVYVCKYIVACPVYH